MPGRNGGVGYRYGFQNQEKDDEIKGNGNSINYKYRMHDSRLGRFFTVDPLMSDYPQWTPYAFSGNQVIHMVELEGLEPAEPGNGHGDVAKDDKGDTYIWSPREDTERKEYDGYGWVFVGQESEIYPSEGTVAKVEVKKIQGQVKNSTLNKYEEQRVKDYIIGLPNRKKEESILPWWLQDGALEGKADGANTGIITDRDIAVGGGMVAIISVPFTFGLSAKGIVLGSLTSANAIDDIGTDENGHSLLQQYFPEQASIIGYTKSGVLLVTSYNGVKQVVTVVFKDNVMKVNPVEIISTGADVVSTVRGIMGITKELSEKEDLK